MTKTQIIQDALNLKPDDIWGAKTDAAVAAEREASRQRQEKVGGQRSEVGDQKLEDGEWKMDGRSERNIGTLLGPVQEVARKFLERLAQNHINAQVISGSRSYAEQNALYEKGRLSPGPIVTNARGGYSNHNFGVAFDIGIFSGGKYLEESPLYAAAGKIGKELGLSWGGDWESIQDEPHFELKPAWAAHLGESQMLAAFRDRVEKGQAIFA